MRLDRYISETTEYSRSQARKLLKAGRITVDGEPIHNAACSVSEQQRICLDEQALHLCGPQYIMLHKPKGYVCSHEDAHHPSALNLLQQPTQDKLHFVGRLDVDTTGLVLITDDGQWSHRITSPKSHCPKQYRVTLNRPLTDAAAAQLCEGVVLKDEEKPTRPAQIAKIGDQEILLTIHEGRYHQVKRMLAAVGNHVDALHREAIGDLQLDPNLKPGEYRDLSEEEIQSFI